MVKQFSETALPISALRWCLKVLSIALLVHVRIIYVGFKGLSVQACAKFLRPLFIELQMRKLIRGALPRRRVKEVPRQKTTDTTHYSFEEKRGELYL